MCHETAIFPSPTVRRLPLGFQGGTAFPYKRRFGSCDCIGWKYDDRGNKESVVPCHAVAVPIECSPEARVGVHSTAGKGLQLMFKLRQLSTYHACTGEHNSHKDQQLCQNVDFQKVSKDAEDQRYNDVIVGHELVHRVRYQTHHVKCPEEALNILMNCNQ